MTAPWQSRTRAGYAACAGAAFALKVAAAALALALASPWGERLPRLALLILGWATGAGITLYAVANFVQHGLMAAGLIATPDALGTSAVAWHLALWDPFWLLGGLLFLGATRAFQRRRRHQGRFATLPAGTAKR